MKCDASSVCQSLNTGQKIKEEPGADTQGVSPILAVKSYLLRSGLCGQQLKKNVTVDRGVEHIETERTEMSCGSRDEDKAHHNSLERQRRKELRDVTDLLRKVVFEDGQPEPKAAPKIVVLKKAVDLIQQLRRVNTQLESEKADCHAATEAWKSESECLEGENQRLTRENQCFLAEQQRMHREIQRLMNENQRLTDESQNLMSVNEPFKWKPVSMRDITDFDDQDSELLIGIRPDSSNAGDLSNACDSGYSSIESGAGESFRTELLTWQRSWDSGLEDDNDNAFMDFWSG